MPVHPARYGQPAPGEPTVHDMPPMRYQGEEVPMRVVVRRVEDGSWRGRLIFGPPDVEGPVTAEILFGATENDLWQAVADLREHHLRDLYRSLSDD